MNVPPLSPNWKPRLSSAAKTHSSFKAQKSYYYVTKYKFRKIVSLKYLLGATKKMCLGLNLFLFRQNLSEKDLVTNRMNFWNILWKIFSNYKYFYWLKNYFQNLNILFVRKIFNEKISSLVNWEIFKIKYRRNENKKKRPAHLLQKSQKYFYKLVKSTLGIRR